MKINICEIFYSIQGESTTAGFPAIFIRLSGCNLRCNYCDTPQSYKTNFEMDIDEIINKIKSYQNFHHICITGGEPLLQNNVYNLMDKLVSLRYRVQIETNGSQNLKQVHPLVKKIVDIKGPSSEEKGSFLEENLNYLTENDEVKFVIASNEDYLFALEYIKNQLQNNGCVINFSPVFGKMPLEKLAKIILENHLNVRLNPQLHKIIWPGGEPISM